MIVGHVLAIITICFIFFTIKYIWKRKDTFEFRKCIKSLTRRKDLSFNFDNCPHEPLKFDSYDKDANNITTTTSGGGINNEEEEGGGSEKMKKKKKQSQIPSSDDIRKWTFDYISSLENEKTSKRQAFLWNKFNACIPDRWKERNQENGLTYPLPEWIEELIRWIYHRNTIHIIYLIITYFIFIFIIFPLLLELYPFSVMIMNSLLGGGGTNSSLFEALKEDDPSILKLVGLYPEYMYYDKITHNFYYYCQSFHSFLKLNSVDYDIEALNKWYETHEHNVTMNHSYCITSMKNSNEVWSDNNKTWPFMFTNHNYKKEDVKIHSINDIFLDGDHRVNFLLNIIESNPLPFSSSSIDNDFIYYEGNKKNHKATVTTTTNTEVNIDSKVKTVITNENTIIDLLNHVYTETNISCICPIFIGIKGNITFLYRNEQHPPWLILHEPYIYRNNTLSPTLETSISYKKEETPVFFHNNMNLNRGRTTTTTGSSSSSSTPTMIHYEIFNVEYTQLNSMNDYSNRMHQDEVNLMKVRSTLLDKSTLFYIPLKKYNNYQTRQRTILSEDEAICFIHCNEMNK